MKDKIDAPLTNILCSRRAFLKCAGATGLFLAGCSDSKKADPSNINPPPPPPSPVRSRVVAVNDNTVTTWDGNQTWYGSDSFVNQTRVDQMVKEGIASLTGQATESDAWGQIIPTYSKGKKISIKINGNNMDKNPGNFIDALPQLLKALVKGLKAGGVDESDIWFLEPSRTIFGRVAQPVKAAYPGVTFYGASATPYSSACTYNSSDPGLTIKHGDPAISDSRLPDQLGFSTYFIHMPILKAHAWAGITLTYKNLFGLFEKSTISKFHTSPPYSFFNTSNNPLVEIYANSNVRGKTVLILGDGIYGNWQDNPNDTVPRPWSVFGNQYPQRIFLSTDPVAIDCVMYDFLQWQRQDLTAQDETYLIQASNANQGTGDHWNNETDKKYSVIDFVQRDMTI